MRLTLIVAALAVSGLAPAWADSLASCATIDADSARLACYDVLAGRTTAAVNAPTAVTQAPQSLETTPEAIPVAAAAKQPATTSAAAEPDVIPAHIVGKFDGWNERTQFTLDNGQVWRVVEDGVSTYRSRENPAAKITKSLLGTHFLEIDELHARVKVERIR